MGLDFGFGLGLWVAFCLFCTSNRSGAVAVHSPLDAGEMVVHISRDIDPDEPSNMSVWSAFECTHRALYIRAGTRAWVGGEEGGTRVVVVVQGKVYPQRFWLNDSASRNMFFMLITFETSHFERSPLNDAAPWNIPDIRRTFDTSHLAME